MKKIIVNNPILISLTYIIILIFYSSLQVNSDSTAMTISRSMATILLVAIAVGWPTNVYFYLGRVIKERGKPISYIGLIALLYFLLNFLTFYAYSFFSVNAILLDNYFSYSALPIVFSVFLFFWCVANRINIAENNKFSILRNILGFLQIFYLPIGVFFVVKRLRSIA